MYKFQSHNVVQPRKNPLNNGILICFISLNPHPIYSNYKQEHAFPKTFSSKLQQSNLCISFLHIIIYNQNSAGQVWPLTVRKLVWLTSSSTGVTLRKMWSLSSSGSFIKAFNGFRNTWLRSIFPIGFQKVCVPAYLESKSTLQLRFRSSGYEHAYPSHL